MVVCAREDLIADSDGKRMRFKFAVQEHHSTIARAIGPSQIQLGKIVATLALPVRRLKASLELKALSLFTALPLH